MKCHLCQEKEATLVVFIVDKEERVRNKLHLCESCASKIPVSCLVLGHIQSLPDRKTEVASEKRDPYLDMECGHCLTTFRECLEKGFLGCSHCYEEFFEMLRESIIQKQTELVYRGKVPLRLSHKKRVERDIREMKKDIQHCVDAENYEKAEQLQRMVKRLESFLK
ncbi:MAG: hypothetical protein WCP87_06830 [Atribacterota bacterium]|nr:hypothetical protein [Candidatus Atribacteria bacterium]